MAVCPSPRRGARVLTTLSDVDAIEIFFTSLLVIMSLVIFWFAGYVVYKLYKGQA